MDDVVKDLEPSVNWLRVYTKQPSDTAAQRTRPLRARFRHPVGCYEVCRREIPPVGEVIIDKGIQRELVCLLRAGAGPDVVGQHAVKPGALDGENDRGRTSAPFIQP